LNGFRAALVAAAFGATTMLTQPAGADGAKKAAAEALFQAGRNLVEAGDLAGACKKFEASQRLDPALGTLLHLGDCLERMSRTASAWAAFEEAASLAQLAGQAQREQIARTRAAALKKRLSRIELRVAQIIPGLYIEIADVPVPEASWGLAVPVDPGVQLVRATAPGYQSWTRRLTIEGDGDVVIEVPPLRPEPPKNTTKAETREPEKRMPVVPVRARSRAGLAPQRKAAIVIGAGGMAGLTAGSILGVRAMIDNDRSRSLCRPDDASLCSAEGVAARRQAQDFALGSTIAFAAGGALLATGVVLFVTAPEATEVAIQSSVSSDHAFLALGGSW
jgi:hypothetical protein